MNPDRVTDLAAFNKKVDSDHFLAGVLMSPADLN